MIDCFHLPSAPCPLPPAHPSNLIHLFVLCKLCDCDDNQPHHESHDVFIFPHAQVINDTISIPIKYDVWCIMYNVRSCPEKSCHSLQQQLFTRTNLSGNPFSPFRSFFVKTLLGPLIHNVELTINDMIRPSHMANGWKRYRRWRQGKGKGKT